MSVLSVFKRAFCCCCRVHHHLWAVGRCVIGQEIYSICVTKTLMKIQVFQYLTLCHSKCLRKPQSVKQHHIPELLPQWHSILSQNYFLNDSVTPQNYFPGDTVLHLRTTHPVTQQHVPEDFNCQKHCCETLRQFGVCMWNLDNTLLIKPLASEECRA
jgi:hypothetical protein